MIGRFVYKVQVHSWGIKPVDKLKLNRWQSGQVSDEAQCLKILGLIVSIPKALLGSSWIRAEYTSSSLKINVSISLNSVLALIQSMNEDGWVKTEWNYLLSKSSFFVSIKSKVFPRIWVGQLTSYNKLNWKHISQNASSSVEIPVKMSQLMFGRLKSLNNITLKDGWNWDKWWERDSICDSVGGWGKYTMQISIW